MRSWLTVTIQLGRATKGTGKRAMAVDIPAIREIMERVCTRPDALDACKRRDLGYVISASSARRPC